MLISQQHLDYSNAALLTFGLCFIASIVVSYPLAEHFTLTTQIASHISNIVLAGLFKISYVLRCVCQYQLGMEVR
ncbi:hypothetical protein J8L98_18580 [Pseudoalteromonas sp. MMG013]|uniref:Uncharacterized protein n=1 Tax=Pseudoalteromonas aurantia 208 TaxID=1314867 RepID=A0ABR9EJJ8_9GAMM|nr:MULTISPECIES: hypothetical protein [Pseudoalteromonas]MBE0370892.1 hypothetical protein [Pseudoalteromonas aurantia 208]MBQ4844651.1 hypothetical protein [Pseudoalteromonas sp. MMG005]MBQ4850409.1 hypothetical protein [Pseudoalteromonas sp. MMG012]MBQ4863691.1 hypothetical protein [Pseudoalteromonas sp. MMG013]